MAEQIREHYYEWDELFLKCCLCKKFLSSDNYTKDRTKRFGFNGRCKQCDRLYHKTTKAKKQRKEYYEKNRVKISKKNKENLKNKRTLLGVNLKLFYRQEQNYIKKNRLRPNVCMICSNGWIIEFHHPSYNNRSEWKKWVFVCKSCHQLIHSWELECPEPVDLIQLNAHMPTILTDKELELCTE